MRIQFADMLQFDGQATVNYYVELAMIERTKAHEILDSARRDRVAVAKHHLRTGLAELKRAKFERDWRKRAA